MKPWLEEQNSPATSQRMLRSNRNETGQGMECPLQPRKWMRGENLPPRCQAQGDEKETEQRNPFCNKMVAWLYASLNTEELSPHTYCLQEVLSVSSLGSILLSHSPAYLSFSSVAQLHKASFACLLIGSPKYPVATIQVPQKKRASW